jgi:hypothetical protein
MSNVEMNIIPPPLPQTGVGAFQAIGIQLFYYAFG